MRGVATSTVAMTAYNLLATASGARTLNELARAVNIWAARCRCVVPDPQIGKAVDELVKRKFVRETVPDSGLLDVCDPMRRPIVERDRSDEGQPNAGWRGWKVHARPVAAPQLVSLEDVVK